MPEVVFSVDQSKSMRDQIVPGQNRWHPDIPVAAMVRPGDEFRVECREWTDAQLGNNDSANDVRDVDLTQAPHAEWTDRCRGRGARRPARRGHSRPRSGTGAAGVRRRPRAGLGLHRRFLQAERWRLPDRLLPGRVKAIWDFHGQVATSRHLPASAIPASPTQGCSVPRHPRICWLGGTSGSGRSSPPTRIGYLRWPCRR